MILKGNFKFNASVKTKILSICMVQNSKKEFRYLFQSPRWLIYRVY